MKPQFGCGQILLFSYGKRLEQTLILLARDLDGSTMTRGELSLGLCVLHKGKGLEVVGALGKLVVAVHVAIVHQAPTTLNKREHASALHSILGNLAIARVQGPCVGLVQVGKGVLPDALMTSSLGFEKRWNKPCSS